jgi:hypothetical protein
MIVSANWRGQINRIFVGFIAISEIEGSVSSRLVWYSHRYYYGRIAEHLRDEGEL